MFDNAVIEVAIGLAFVYCIYSLFTTIINEIIASALSLRARMLKRAIKRMLMDNDETFLGKKLFNEFFEHPLIKYMSSGFFYRTPSYISQGSFSKTLIDILKKYDSPDTKSEIQKVKDKLDELGKKENLPKWESDTIKLINSFLNDAKDDLDKFKDKLEGWFNDTMERASGWYKRQTQLIIIFLGFILAIGFNVNTFEIVSRLSNDKAAREQIINIAENYVKDRQSTVSDTSTSQRLDSLVLKAKILYEEEVEPVNQIFSLGLASWDQTGGFWNSILGCLITALAISLGAPFWFDMLSKLVKLRGTGSKPAEEKEKEKTSAG